MNLSSPQTSSHLPYTIEWVKKWRDTYHNYGKRIVIDSNDNIYQVGTSYNNSLFGYDISLNKLDKNGNVLWNITIGGQISDYGVDISLDSKEDIYIVGTMDFANLDFNSTIVTIKYDKDGNKIWMKESKRYDSGRSRAKGIAIDSQDNIYTVGTIQNFPRNATLLKYNSTGHSIWNITIEGWLNEYGNDVAVDSNDDVYLVGETQSFIENATVIKFNDNGIQLLNFTWLQNEEPQAERIIIDSNDRIYVSGTYTEESKVFLVRYDTNGNFIWNYSLPTIPNFKIKELTVDSKGNIFMVGDDSDLMYVYMIDPDGKFIWYDTWANQHDGIVSFQGISVDSNDNIFISGSVPDGGLRDNYILIKYAPPPELGDLLLSSNASSPDVDGIIDLAWNHSANAVNYSVYSYGSLITEINGSLNLIANQNATSPFRVFLENGNYSFVVVAYNDFGFKMSNNIHVRIEKPVVPSESISGFNILLFTIGFFGIMIFLSLKLTQRNINFFFLYF